jgi:hypothetical protein
MAGFLVAVEWGVAYLIARTKKARTARVTPKYPYQGKTSPRNRKLRTLTRTIETAPNRAIVLPTGIVVKT